MPTSRRHLENKEIKKARIYGEAEAERLHTSGELHPETRAMLKSMNLESLHPADYGRLTWAASEFLHGNMTRDGWREAQRAVGTSSVPSTVQRPPSRRPSLIWRSCIPSSGGARSPETLADGEEGGLGPAIEQDLSQNER